MQGGDKAAVCYLGASTGGRLIFGHYNRGQPGSQNHQFDLRSLGQGGKCRTSAWYMPINWGRDMAVRHG